MKPGNFGTFILTGIMVSLLATSCLNDRDSNQYTAQREQELLYEYIANMVKSGYNVDTTAKGVFYVTIDQGTGAFPKSGDTLSVQYAGYLVTGELFDASLYHSPDSTFHFVYKGDPMIEGWDDMMSIMNKGRKVQFVVPSNLAYGDKGSGLSIPPYTSLVFVAKMMNIKPKNN
jgi:FKBP-type peptidyl-prolyl cis-trans isomerase FkpA